MKLMVRNTTYALTLVLSMQERLGVRRVLPKKIQLAIGCQYFRKAQKNFPVKDNGDGTESHVGGVTENNKKIVMNSKYDNMRRRIHEIFHTLFLIMTMQVD